MSCVIGRRVISQVGIHGNAQSGLLADLLLLLLLSSFVSSSTGSEAAENNLCRCDICRLLLNDEDDDVFSI